MTNYSLTHLSDQTLLRDLAALVTRDRSTTAELLAHIAEVDARKLYVPAGYPSMHLYCVHELRLSEDAARKRIHAARTARRIPAVFVALAEGRLHLTAVILLAPYVSQENAHELLAAATHKTKLEIEQLIAERFPRLDVPDLVQALPAAQPVTTRPTDERAPGRVGAQSEARDEQRAPERVAASVPRAGVQPLAPERFALQFTFGKRAHDKLRYAQVLLSHQVPTGRIAEVFERALDSLIGQLEKRKFAAADKPKRSHRHAGRGSRYIPADVKRTVWERDGGQCTFVSKSGRRCPACSLLEFDHIDPVARGGKATAERMRLRCRAHNQYAAECAFGAEFMDRKRQAAATKPRERVAAAEQAQQDVILCLRRLGFRADEVRGAAALCESMADASLEERVRVALSYFHRRSTATTRSGAAW